MSNPTESSMIRFGVIGAGRIAKAALGNPRHADAIGLVAAQDVEGGRVIRRSGLLHRGVKLERLNNHLWAGFAREPGVAGWQHVMSPEMTKPAAMAGFRWDDGTWAGTSLS